VVAIGNPLGSLGGTLTTGIISATERAISIDGEDMVLLQTNAAINPGNSGGGLFNMAGQLIGVVNAKAAGEDVEGLGVAIPVDFAHKDIEDLVNYGYVRGVVDHGLILLDVTAQNLPSAYRKYGITNIGVVILVSSNTDDLKYGDTVLTVDGQEVNSSSEVELILKSFRVGDTVEIAVMRGDQIVAVQLTLKEKVPDTVSFQ
jgi:serine protease Do